MGGIPDGCFDLLSKQIFIFDFELGCNVVDISRCMFDDETGGWDVEIGGRELLVLLMMISQIGDEG